MIFTKFYNKKYDQFSKIFCKRISKKSKTVEKNLQKVDKTDTKNVERKDSGKKNKKSTEKEIKKESLPKNISTSAKIENEMKTISKQTLNKDVSKHDQPTTKGKTSLLKINNGKEGKDADADKVF